MKNFWRNCCRCGLPLDEREPLFGSDDGCGHPEPIDCVRKLQAANAKLRELLAYRVAKDVLCLYTDDGELQDQGAHPAIDWRRDSVEVIENKLRLRAQKALGQAPEASA